jgi:hypothetical protein
MTSKIRFWYVLSIVAIFVFLFLYTAVEKLKDIDRFIYTIETIDRMKPFAHFAGWAVPILELIVVLLLAIPHSRYIGLCIGTVLMGAFTTYVGFMLSNVSHLPCTCGGVLERMNWREHLYFNSILTLLGLIATLSYPTHFVRMNRISRTPV